MSADAPSNFGIGDAFGIAGVGLQAFGALKGSSAARKAARRAEQIGRLNAEDAEESAVDAVERGNRLQSLLNLSSSRLLGAQRAAGGAANLNTDFGSIAQVQDEAEYFAELDALTVRDNVDNEVEGFLHQARVARLGGQAQASAIRNQGIGQLLSSIGNIASSTSDLLRVK